MYRRLRTDVGRWLDRRIHARVQRELLCLQQHLEQQLSDREQRWQGEFREVQGRFRQELLSARAQWERELPGRVARLRLEQPLIFGDPARVHIGEHVDLNDALINVTSGEVRIEATAFLGHRVSLLTGTHDIDKHGLERQRAVPESGRDILIERGAWLSSNVTVLGPARIGAHAVIGAGALVTGDIAPGAVLLGPRARPTGRSASPHPAPGASADPGPEV